MKDKRCPVCGAMRPWLGNPYYGYGCVCIGWAFLFAPWVQSLRNDPLIEQYRQQRIAAGLGWSYLVVRPKIDRREEFGDR